MNSQDVQTVNGKLDAVLVTLAAVVALGGVLGFSLLSEQSLLARLGILAGGLVAGLVIAWFLFLVDKGLEWVLYDLLLGWK